MDHGDTASPNRQNQVDQLLVLIKLTISIDTSMTKIKHQNTCKLSLLLLPFYGKTFFPQKKLKLSNLTSYVDVNNELTFNGKHSLKSCQKWHLHPYLSFCSIINHPHTNKQRIQRPEPSMVLPTLHLIITFNSPNIAGKILVSKDPCWHLKRFCQATI